MKINFQPYPIPTCCPYCPGTVILTSNDYIYGRLYERHGNSNIYVCTGCKASVGTHYDGRTPLGRMANAELKALKMTAHTLFDPMWKSGRMKRKQAYNDLAKKLGIPVRECHFGWFDKPMLLKAIQILNCNPKGGIPCE